VITGVSSCEEVAMLEGEFVSDSQSEVGSKVKVCAAITFLSKFSWSFTKIESD
jgi:hypothetical protein